jgi:hypothetical protein
MSIANPEINVEDIIHFVIFYKKIVRQFLGNFRKKYLRGCKGISYAKTKNIF